uniref:SURP and Gpatch domaincontaining protein 1like [Metaseiulus occidentalis] n=2 Tax=Lepeophtheirus salmonis TaxID=72036 RepID=A0A0K2UER4_LEPSM
MAYNSGGNARHRQNRRLNEMTAQESLISKKKAEIEDRLRLKDHEENPSTTTEDDDKRAAAAAAAAALMNKFANDGSFMEQFMKLKRKTTEDDECCESLGEIKVPKIQENDHESFHDPEEEESSQLPFQPESISATIVSDHGSSCAPPTNSSFSSSTKTESSGQNLNKEAGVFSSASSSSSAVVELLIQVPLSIVAEELASMVAVSGDQLEEIARRGNAGEDELSFLYDTKSVMYQSYRKKVDTLRNGIMEECRQAKEGNNKKRKTRWGDENDKIAALAHPEKSKELLMYAVRVFGSIDLEPHQWKQCEDQIKMNIVYQDILKKQEETKKFAAQGKHKYEYDSDEDIEGGTWEHKARRLEMDKTLTEAESLTESAKGKHHIGDFLPPEELSKFMAKYQALKDGTNIEESDYINNKITEDNKGFKLLQKMGWSEGGGLGSSGQGITTPISNNGQGSDKKGLGISKPHELDKADDEFDAYRKRMMMAYRFRPNPLNNPRRAYY